MKLAWSIYLLVLVGFVLASVSLLREHGLAALGTFAATLLAVIYQLAESNKRPAKRQRGLRRILGGGELATKRKVLLLCLALVLIPLVYYRFPAAEKVPPSLDLTWYDGPSIVNPDSLFVHVNHADFKHDYIRVPLCVAIRSTDEHPLKIMRLEFIYNDSLKVRSTASPRVMPGRFIYERNIDYLDSRSSGYALIAPVDTVVIPFQFSVVRYIKLATNGVPLLGQVISGENPAGPHDIVFDIQVLCDGRAPKMINVRLRTERAREHQSYDDGFRGQAMTDSYRALLAPDPQPSPSVVGWECVAPDSVTHVEYRRVLSKGNTLQLFMINGIVRKALVDKGTDGTVDAMLIDRHGNGVVDSVLVPTSEHPVVDWIPIFF